MNTVSSFRNACGLFVLLVTAAALTGCPQDGPAASFDVSTASGVAPLEVAFTDTSTPGSDPITAWAWDFDDGTTDEAQSPSHTFAHAGTYTVQLTVTTGVGSDTFSLAITVTAPDSPVAAFTVQPASGIAPLAVQFTDASTAGSWPITARLWNFGDGNAATVANPAHTYAAPGNYTVSLTVTTLAGSNTKTVADCVVATTPPVGAISVAIAPEGARQAGAGWRIGSGAVHGSGDTVTGLAPGDYTITFTALGANWTTPSPITLTVQPNETATGTGQYVFTPSTGSLLVTLEPAEARAAGAAWMLDGGAEHASGETLTGIAPGNHAVSFTNIGGGWGQPEYQTITVESGKTSTVTGTYKVPTATVTVTLLYGGADARWRLDGGDERSSADTVTDVPLGTHTVSFKDVGNGYVKPPDQTFTADLAHLSFNLVIEYLQVGSIQIILDPQEVRDGGGAWMIDGGAEHASGELVSGVPIGNHVITLKQVPHWTPPGEWQSEKPIIVSLGQTFAQTVQFTKNTGSISVTIQPANAAVSGRWILDGIEHVSGAVVSGVSIGDHVVSFKDIVEWTTPPNQTLTVSDFQVANGVGTYTFNPKVGSLRVFIAPQAATDAGATWSVDGGPPHASGETATNLMVTQAHTINFSVLGNGWISPHQAQIAIQENQTTDYTATYTATGSLQVTLEPAVPQLAGARWILDGGAEHASGETLTGLVAGPHLLEYKPIANWTAPTMQSVTISLNETAHIVGRYQAVAGSIHAVIEPAGALTSGATWAIDGSGEYASGETVPYVPLGSHTVSFKDIGPGWIAPEDQTVDVALDATSEAAGEYLPQIMLTVGNANAMPQSQATIQIMLAGFGHQPAVVSFELNYDAEKLIYVPGSAVKGPTVTAAGETFDVQLVSPGRLRLVAFGSLVGMGDGEFCSVSFTVGAVAVGTEMPLTMSEISASDPDAIVLEVLPVPGEVTVGGTGKNGLFPFNAGQSKVLVPDNAGGWQVFDAKAPAEPLMVLDEEQPLWDATDPDLLR